MTEQPPTCERPACERPALVGIGVFEGPPVWVCDEHLEAYLEGVAAVVDVAAQALRSTS